MTYYSSLMLSIQFRDLKEMLLDRINRVSRPKKKNARALTTKEEEEEDKHFSWVWCLVAMDNLLTFRLQRPPETPKTESDVRKKLVDVAIETWEEIWACLLKDTSWTDQCRVGLNGVSSRWQASLG